MSGKIKFCQIRHYLYKKRNNLLNKIMNIKENNQSFKIVIQFFRNTSSSRIVFNLFNYSET